MRFFKQGSSNFSKKQQKETDIRVEEYKKRILEISDEMGFAMIPIMTKYGMEFEIVPKPKEEKK